MKRLFAFLLLTSFFSCQGEPFHGARVIANLYYANLDGQSLITPTRVRVPGQSGYTYLQPGDPGYVDHYELYAGIDGLGTVRLMNFHIRPAIEVHHPCLQFLEDTTRLDGVGEGPFYFNMCRNPYPDLENLMLVVVSAPPTGLGTVNPGYNFYDWGADLRTPASPTTPDCATNTRFQYVKEATEAFCSQLHERYYLGNPFQLTKPLSGEFLGVVDGIDPRTNLATGGLSLSLKYDLSKVTSLFIVAEPDPGRLSLENYHLNLPPGQGEVVLMSQLDGYYGYLDKQAFDGVWHGLMVHPQGRGLYLEYTLYHDLDTDKVWF